MKACDNTILRQAEITLKRAFHRCRLNGDYEAKTIAALARLLREYRELKALEEGLPEAEAEDEFSNNYHTLLCSKDGVPIQDPSKNKKKIEIFKRRR